MQLKQKQNAETSALQVFQHEKEAIVQEAERSNKLLRDKLAASCEERRKLYNELQDMKGKIRVFVRVRPMNSTEATRGDTMAISFPEGKDVLSLEQTASGENSTTEHRFVCDGVFPPQSTQSDVYEETKRLVQSCIDGFNVCIFVYGQTGSGKTWTMSGHDGDLMGIQPRAVQTIFTQKTSDQKSKKVEVKVRMLELYNGNVIDLLCTKSGDDQKVTIISHPDNVVVRNAVVMEADTVEQMNDIIRAGLQRRHTGATKMNADSSRSHLVTTFFVSTSYPNLETTVEGKFNLIDLAGAESQKKTGPGGEVCVRKWIYPARTG
jgi:hypothetical protein